MRWVVCLVSIALWSCASAPSPQLVKNVEDHELAASQAQKKMQELRQERQSLEESLQAHVHHTARMQHLIDSLRMVHP